MHNDLAITTSKKILEGFKKHYALFRQVSKEAKKHFEYCNWDELLASAQQRIYFYDKQIDKFSSEFTQHINPNLFDEELWIQTKLAYTHLNSAHPQPELAETFYNSVFCRLFDKQFYNNTFIFVRPSISTAFIDMVDPVVNSYYIEQGNLKQHLNNILTDVGFQTHFQNLDRDINRLSEQLEKQLGIIHTEYFEIQTIKTPLIRRNTAYIVGKIVTQTNITYPLLIALMNDKKEGLYVDALLTDVNNISIVFSFSRSYFFIDIKYPAAIVDFLKGILPNKTKATLYSLIGLHKQGKTLLYRHFLKYSRLTNEKLIIAPGIKGMVMTVFTFPMFPYVFKVINDKFAFSKNITKQEVKDKYFFVKNHRRVGRMADTWEFSNVAFRLNDLDNELLAEFRTKIPSNISIKGDFLVIKHLYMENKMTPLDLYIKQTDASQTEYIINDYGKAITELISANIFPGDMLTKNFGVTRQNRVVFYDYDEITTMDVPNFRKIPPARCETDKMSPEPWYSVGENDVFPEEFKFFMFGDERKKQIFNKLHNKLLDPNYWKSVQNDINNGKIYEHYPYEQQYRMENIYK